LYHNLLCCIILRSHLGDGAGAGAGDAGQAHVLGDGEAAVGGSGGVARRRDEEAAAGAHAQDDGEADAGGEEDAGEGVEDGGAAPQLRHFVCDLYHINIIYYI
jgi:hypothetical protein